MAFRHSAAVVLVALMLPVSIVSKQPARNQVNPGEQVKRALLVGVSDYDNQIVRRSLRGRMGNGQMWTDLNSDSDVRLLKLVLIRKFGFKPENVKILSTPRETTKASIINAFRSHLITQTNPGDVIFFHYSGHGQKIPDDNGDELDGYDESIVPIDYISKTDESHNIRDDEIGGLLEELAQKRPMNVTVTFDSCFSGTVTRGRQFLVRGGPWTGRQVQIVRRGADNARDDGPGSLRSATLAKLSNFFFLSATNQNQLASETVNEQNEDMGLFTWALIKALNASTPQTSYLDLRESLSELMHRQLNGNQSSHRQDPQVEGDLDREVLGSTALRAEPFFTVNTETRNGANYLKIPAGKLQGMTVGSRFALHPPGTKSADPSNALAFGRIKETKVLDSYLQLETPLSPEKLIGLRAFEIEHNYGNEIMALAVRNLDGQAWSGLMKEIRSFDPEPYIMPKANFALESKRYDILVAVPEEDDRREGVVDRDFKGILLQRQNGTLIDKISSGPDLFRGVSTALEREARRLLVVSLEKTDPKLSIKIRVVPVEVKRGENYPESVNYVADLTPRFNENGFMQFRAGDHLMLEVKNDGLQSAYVTILNLRSDGLVGPAWPQKGAGQGVADDENLVKNDGEWHRIGGKYIFVVEDLPGIESFRAIATSEKSDFSNLIDPELKRGELYRSAMDPGRSPLYRRFLRINDRKNFRSGLANVDSPAAWATAVFSFEVVRP